MKILKVPGVVVTDEAELRVWLASKEHNYDCIGYSEGQWCCLEKMIEQHKEDDGLPD